MAVITKKIGTGTCSGLTCDYSTLQSWEDALPANLVTDGNIQSGECYNDGEFADGFITSTLDISAHTTDSTHYIQLICASGQSFRDNASVQTNALKYNQSNGVAIKNTSNYNSIRAINCLSNFTRFVGLQVKGVTDSCTIRIAAADCLIDFCILELTNGNGGFNGASAASGNKVRNSLMIQRLSAATLIINPRASGWEFYNCTIVCPSDITASTNGVGQGYGGSTWKNCAIFGATGVRAEASGTWTTCMSDATGFTGCTGGKTYANQFQDTTNASGDWRAKAAADLLDAATTDSTNAANDIAGTARPQGSAYDIGAWELVAAAGGSGGEEYVSITS